MTVVLPNNEEVSTSECYNVSFKLENRIFKHIFYVLDINSDIILGNDFLRRFKVLLDYSDMTAVLSEEGNTVTVPIVSKAYAALDVIDNLNKITLKDKIK